MNKLKAIYFKYRPLLMEYNEFWLAPIMFVLHLISIPVLRWIDPTSGIFDLGIYQSLIVMAVSSSFVFGIAWLQYRLTFPQFNKWMDDVMEVAPTSTTQDFWYRKSKLTLAVFGFYLIVNTIILINLI